jgi:predicted dehydrogenase
MDRRHFISTTLGSLGLTLAPRGFTAESHSAEPLRLGVIGTGARGSGLIKTLSGNPLFDVAACCDLLDFRLQAAVELTGGRATGQVDYRQVLDDPAIEAVIVATPFFRHAEHLLAALDAGKHVYLEKTAVMGHADIDRVAGLAREHSQVVQVGYQWRHSALYQRVVELIRQGEIGQVAQIECHWNRNGDWRRPVPSPDLERLINWRMYREYSGGLSAELCSHQMDFCNWLLGEKPEAVLGTGGIDYWKDGRETRDNIHLIVTYPGGVDTTFHSLTTNARDGYRISVLGSEGTIDMTFSGAWISYEDPERRLGDVDAVSGATIPGAGGRGQAIHVPTVEPTQQALLNFRTAARGESPVLSTLEDGLLTSRIVQASLDAMDTSSRQILG